MSSFKIHSSDVLNAAKYQANYDYWWRGRIDPSWAEKAAEKV